MTYEKIISVITGWIGRSVAVHVEDGAARTVVMAARGQLNAAELEDATTIDGRMTLGIWP